MESHRKEAYRFLLYWALLEIRMVEWTTWRPLRLLNPFIWRRELRRLVRAGALADWLHNLAHFSSLECENFDEEWFWKDYDRFAHRYGQGNNCDYRKLFESRLAEATSR